jgi:regulatory protein
MDDDVTEDSPVYAALVGAALRFVSYRARSEKELRDFLTKKLKNSHTTAPMIFEKVMARMFDYGYVNDEQFARDWVASRLRSKPKGTRLLELELLRKGIAKDIIDQTISQAFGSGEADERSLAKAVAEKRAAVWMRYSGMERKKKLFDLLSRRGFPYDVIAGVIDELMENKVK